MRGALTISIDLEGAWGIWDKPSPAYHARCAAAEREIVDGLVGIFDRHHVAATWAIVARLLERDEVAAGKTAFGDRIWYAPDAIARVRAAEVAQDIGSHTYAHPYFQERPRDELAADLQAARRVHDAHGLPFTSFVFPRNQVAHLDLLRAAGVRVFRSVDHGWYMGVRARLGATAGRLANLVDKTLPVPPTAVHPVDHGDGLVELPSSMLLLGRNGARRVVHPATIVAKARLGLAAARRTGGVFHLWFHPSNFYYDTARQLETLSKIIEIAAAMRDRAELDIRPMSSFAAAA
jgi:hypothetical protein